MSADNMFGRIGLLLVLVILVSGCSSKYAPALLPTDIPNDELAYVYGRFTRLDDPNDKTDEDPFRQIGLVIKSGEKDKYMFRFDIENDLYAISVEPGRYCISKWAGTTKWGGIQVAQKLEGQIQDNDFHLKSGNAYYLGDFVSYFRRPMWQMCELYYLSVPKNCFEKTTEDFVAEYPLFKYIPKSRIFEYRIFREEFSAPRMIQLDTKYIYMVVPSG